jgi:hypothetical protein
MRDERSVKCAVSSLAEVGCLDCCSPATGAGLSAVREPSRPRGPSQARAPRRRPRRRTPRNSCSYVRFTRAASRTTKGARRRGWWARRRGWWARRRGWWARRNRRARNRTGGLILIAYAIGLYLIVLCWLPFSLFLRLLFSIRRGCSWSATKSKSRAPRRSRRRSGATRRATRRSRRSTKSRAHCYVSAVLSRHEHP